jgi:hypothetical protein
MAMVTISTSLPVALNVVDDDIPYAESWLGVEGIDLKVLVANVEGGFFALLRQQGKPLPRVIEGGAARFSEDS